MPKKQLVGTVVSDKLDKTRTVQISEKVKHPKYGKFVNRTKKYLIHDENNEAKLGDLVSIEESRPYSARKRFRLASVIMN